MKQPQTVETIVERMRAAAGMSPSVAGSDEAIQLRDEIALAQEGSRQTGQLNPREAGTLNQAVQFSKKVMRRSLTWYTRPLHMFQGAVIRALQHTGNIIDDHRSQLHQHSEALNLQADVIERNQAWLAQQIQSERTANEQSLGRLREKMEATFASRESLAAAVENRLVPLQAKVNALENAAQDIARLQSENHQLRWHVESLRDNFNAIHATVRDLAERNRWTSIQLRGRERDLRRLLKVVGGDSAPPMSTAVAPVPPMFRADIKDELTFDYFAFEEQYRGDEADIREKQQAYVDYFRGRDNVVDLGCGRGEFLEALRDAGIPARGVEVGTDQILLCQEKGLEVVQQDLFAFLESAPDDSLGGIFSSQVMEHMTAGDQLRYVALAYQKCRPGSPVIFETINPQCVYALVRNFFLDPTHIRPVHPETLRFAMESSNFRDVTVRFAAPLSEMQVPPLKIEGTGSSTLEQFNAGIGRVNELLYGFQDYAAIGWK
jgi:SAM-dependent methyltransferase